MTEAGKLSNEGVIDSDEDPDTPSNVVCPSSEDPSRFASNHTLTKLYTTAAKGIYDSAFTHQRKHWGHDAALYLAAEPMRTMKAKIQEVYTDYIAEFPHEKVPDNMPSATLNNQGTSAAQQLQVTEIKATSRIENEVEYQMALAI